MGIKVNLKNKTEHMVDPAEVAHKEPSNLALKLFANMYVWIKMDEGLKQQLDMSKYNG